MKLVSPHTGIIRRVKEVTPEGIICYANEDDPYPDDDDTSICSFGNTTKNLSCIEYEVGDKVVILKEWKPHGPGRPDTVGQEGVITETAYVAGQGFKARIKTPVDHSWWYFLGDWAPLGSGITTPIEPVKPSYRVIN